MVHFLTGQSGSPSSSPPAAALPSAAVEAGKRKAGSEDAEAVDQSHGKWDDEVLALAEGDQKCLDIVDMEERVLYGIYKSTASAAETPTPRRETQASN